MTTIYIDADACPVKEETVKAALRHRIAVYIVSNRWQRGEQNPLIHRVVVPPEPDAADKWIAEAIQREDICITNDIPLAAHCLEREAHVIRPDGSLITQQSVGNALAMRDLMAHLRETGEITGGPASYNRQDRVRFLDSLERLIQASLRASKALESAPTVHDTK